MPTEPSLSPAHARPGARGVAAALFASRTQAQGAIQDLQGAGFDAGHIGLALRDRDAQDQLLAETGTQAAGGAGLGAAGGGVVGGLAGLLVGLGALVIPGVGPVIAGRRFGVRPRRGGGHGPGRGGARRGHRRRARGVGRRRSAEVEAKRLHEGFAAGGVLVTVEAGEEDRRAEAESLLENAGGDLGRGASSSSSSGTEAPATTPGAHGAAAQVEVAGQVAPPPARPVSDDTSTDDFIGTRRLTDDDTGSRMTI